MKTRVLVALLLLAICTVIYASEDINDPELYWRKTQEMNQMVERFKEDTGFEGQISYGYKRMRLGSFEGNFSDIPFTANADTTAFREACERIVEKLLPYSAAKRMQLSMCRIEKQLNGFTTDYRQQVNGYRLEGSGFIMITYEAGRKHFSIGDNTVMLPFDNISPVLSYEDAVRIYDEHIVDDEVTKNIRKTTPFLGISFCNISASESADIMPVYRLCWVGGWYKKIYIDALTGKIYKIIDNKSDDRMINVSAHVMPYSDNIGSFLTTVVSLDSTEVTANCDGVPSEIRYTNGEGSILLLGNEITDIESCLMASCGIKVFKKSGGWVKHNSLITDLPNLVFNYTDTDSVPTGNPSNLYYSALRFRDKIKELMVLNGSSCYYGSTLDEPIITADCDLGPETNGQILYGTQDTPSKIEISTGNGRYSSTLCHEMTHDMVNRSLIFNSFRYGSTSELRGAMDDAFSSYFPCMYRNNPYYRSSLYTKGLSDPALTVASVHSSEYPTSTVNEDIYARYDMRFPLASAWWDLRNRTHFPDLNDNDFNAVDTLLVGALGIVKRELDDNATYRYKPRYFYNILMKRVDDDTTPYPLNPKQVAIQKAYTSRGFHFYPRVQSHSLAQKPRNSFSPGNQVHVNITEAPQNTPFKVYVIRHGDYTYINGASVSTLNDHLASEFTPIEESTHADGKWSGLIWTIPTIAKNAVGDYDIIVDFGSPEQPDGRIHFAFNAADVMDGFDGLNGPGFTVYDDSIDVATSSVKSSYQRMLID
ncbi:MAG: hypothetical protein LHW56_04590 [Candidatus Cloacimonetes bacterium]|nr:hypothetical protein [Candidatus Cloacimonadota bacterium]MDY0172167.1 hypothetical protein [Candidatus Cloacimonadaceae bacterium]